MISLSPLPPIALGAWIARAHGLSSTGYLANFGCAAIGFLWVAAFEVKPREILIRHATAIAGVALLLLTRTLADAGIQGVHRWMVMGAVRLNLSMAITPLILAAIYSLACEKRRIALALAPAAVAIHLLQPDSGQATACAAASIVILWRAYPRHHFFGSAILITAIAAGAWYRSDPLTPVPQVEQIVSLALQMGAPVKAAVAAALLFALSPFLMSAAAGYSRWVLVYFSFQFIVTGFGNFPVPLFGAGAGPVIGWYVSLNLFINRKQKEQA